MCCCGGMDASQYKDYVLFLLFIKHITAKYGSSSDFAPPVTIPKGASFTDMLAPRGKRAVGDKINTQAIAPPPARPISRATLAWCRWPRSPIPFSAISVPTSVPPASSPMAACPVPKSGEDDIRLQ